MRQMRGTPRPSRADTVLSAATTAMIPPAVPTNAPDRRSDHDPMRRVLRDVSEDPPSRPNVRRAFSASVFLSAARCLSTYVILPFVAPALGIAAQVGPGFRILLGGVAVAANIVSIRRFWCVDHPWRWAYTPVGVVVIALFVVLVAGDIAELGR